MRPPWKVLPVFVAPGLLPWVMAWTVGDHAAVGPIVPVALMAGVALSLGLAAVLRARSLPFIAAGVAISVTAALTPPVLVFALAGPSDGGGCRDTGWTAEWRRSDVYDALPGPGNVSGLRIEWLRPLGGFSAGEGNLSPFLANQTLVKVIWEGETGPGDVSSSSAVTLELWPGHSVHGAFIGPADDSEVRFRLEEFAARVSSAHETRIDGWAEAFLASQRRWASYGVARNGSDDVMVQGANYTVSIEGPLRLGALYDELGPTPQHEAGKAGADAESGPWTFRFLLPIKRITPSGSDPLRWLQLDAHPDGRLLAVTQGGDAVSGRSLLNETMARLGLEAPTQHGLQEGGMGACA